MIEPPETRVRRRRIPPKRNIIYNHSRRPALIQEHLLVLCNRLLRPALTYDAHELLELGSFLKCQFSESIILEVWLGSRSCRPRSRIAGRSSACGIGGSVSQ